MGLTITVPAKLSIFLILLPAIIFWMSTILDQTLLGVIIKLLDRCLVNSVWSSNFDSYFVKHLSRTCFDHSPILLNAYPRAFSMFFALIIIGLLFELSQCGENCLEVFS